MSIDVSLVVPRFRETEADVFPLLASVAGQLGVDLGGLEVIVANDGGGAPPLSGEFLGLFPALTVRQVALDGNRGPGVARQAGIDAARGRWLMFADADDRLHSVGAVGALLECAEREGCDLLNSEWLEETRDPATGAALFVRHDDEWTWMHGKLLRASYLRDVGVRHCPRLRVHEDTYYLSMATALGGRIAHLPALTYVWTWRDDSITRRDGGAYTFGAMPTFVQAACQAMDDLDGRIGEEAMRYKAVQLVAYVYCALSRDEWRGHGAAKAEAEAALARRLGGRWRLWDGAEPAYVAAVLAGERAKNPPVTEDETLAQWAARIRR